MCADHLNAAAAAPTIAWIIHAVVEIERERDNRREGGTGVGVY